MSLFKLTRLISLWLDGENIAHNTFGLAYGDISETIYVLNTVVKILVFRNHHETHKRICVCSARVYHTKWLNHCDPNFFNKLLVAIADIELAYANRMIPPLNVPT